jgi:ketosteroid isomerase-like protein
VSRAEEFEQLRALLFAIAYRILGSVSEAEDASAVGRSEAACRQLAVRARRHMNAGRPRFEADRQSCRHRNTDKAITLTLLRNAAGLTSSALSGKEEAMAEALIRQRIEDLAKALRAKDIDGVMSLYAPNIVSFDIVPPLRYVGADNKRRAWQEAFAAYTGPFAYEVYDLNVTTHGELAFVHSLNHVNATLASGHITDLWLRWTACLRRIDGVWLVVHDHVSVPADLEHGHAVLNLTP